MSDRAGRFSSQFFEISSSRSSSRISLAIRRSARRRCRRTSCTTFAVIWCSTMTQLSRSTSYAPRPAWRRYRSWRPCPASSSSVSTTARSDRSRYRDPRTPGELWPQRRSHHVGVTPTPVAASRRASAPVATAHAVFPVMRGYSARPTGISRPMPRASARSPPRRPATTAMHVPPCAETSASAAVKAPRVAGIIRRTAIVGALERAPDRASAGCGGCTAGHKWAHAAGAFGLSWVRHVSHRMDLENRVHARLARAAGVRQRQEQPRR